MAEMERLTVGERAEPINLTQVLKRAGWVMHGSEAKACITEGRVRVNGETEYRKRRKMSIGDVVEMDDALKLVLV